MGNMDWDTSGAMGSENYILIDNGTINDFSEVYLSPNLHACNVLVDLI